MRLRKQVGTLRSSSKEEAVAMFWIHGIASGIAGYAQQKANMGSLQARFEVRKAHAKVRASAKS